MCNCITKSAFKEDFIDKIEIKMSKQEENKCCKEETKKIKAEIDKRAMKLGSKTLKMEEKHG